MKSKLILLGKRLREARLRAGLSQVDIAKRIGKSKQLVSAWEAGRAEMTATTLGEYSRIVTSDAGWLLQGVRYHKGGPDAATLPQGCVLPLLSEAEAMKLVRGNLELEAIPRRIYGSFASGASAFALEIQDDAMTNKLARGDIVVVEPGRTALPGGIVAAVVKEVDAVLVRPILVVRHIHYRSPNLASAPFDLVPSVAAWPSLTIRKSGHAIVLGAVAMIFKQEGRTA